MNFHHTDSAACLKSKNQLHYQSLDPTNKMALPLHIQNLEKALNLNTFLEQVHSLIDDKRDEKLNLNLSKQQSKDVKSSIYSFAKTGKNKNWLKNILIDNSDESNDEDIGAEVEQLLKMRRKNYNKQRHKTTSNKIDSNLSSNLLSLSDSVPLNSLFAKKNGEKNSSHKTMNKKKSSTTTKKKVKFDVDVLLVKSTPNKLQDNNSTNKQIDKTNMINNHIKDDHSEPYQMNTINHFFEPTLNSKSFHNKNENDLIDSACLDTKLLDDIKYESSLPDDLLQSEANMNDFVNSFLPNMNDQIIYSNQLPDEIFETEEEISTEFQVPTYDLNKLTKVHSHQTTIHETVLCKTQPSISVERASPVEASSVLVEPSLPSGTPSVKNETVNCINDEQVISSVQTSVNVNTINLINQGSTIKLSNATTNKSNSMSNCTSSNTIMNPSSMTVTTISDSSVVNEKSLSCSINKFSSKVANQLTVNLVPNQLANTTNPINRITSELAIDGTTLKLISKSVVVKKKEKSNKNLPEIDLEQIQHKRRKLWISIVKKDIPKAYKTRLAARKETLNNCKKLVICCSKERKNIIGIPKLNKEKSKKLNSSNKEMATYKRNESQKHQEIVKCSLLTRTDESSISMSIVNTTTTPISSTNEEHKSN